ncbi:uncharacterized protein [Amphiura filiformis]|uniref:uncharacterized protein isoform X1 n=1 Tax=Amphiura filiformis TaxID=82378 RepID=UPI003B21965B
MWELQGWRDLEEKNKELRKSMAAAYDEGNREAVSNLQLELRKYMKGIFTKRRTMATHLLIFMISDELRNRKPYAVPVRVMPVASVKDLTIRALQVELKTVMEELNMKVVGFVTDGEWNSLRTMGTTRPTSIIQLIMQAKEEASKMRIQRLEDIFKPNLQINTPAPGQVTIIPKLKHEAVPHDDVAEIGIDMVRGLSFKEAMHKHHKRIYRWVPNPLPWVPGTSQESVLECMRSVMTTYLLRWKIRYYKENLGIDFSQNLYIPENAETDEVEDFNDREDDGHLFKRIVKCARCGNIEDCDISRWIEAMQDETTGLTAKALRGVDPQSVPDCERMFGKGVVDFLEKKGYDADAKFAKIVHNWHKATDGRGLSEEQRSQYNQDMLYYILDEWMPFHRQHHDFSQVDVNKPLKGIRGLSRETIIGITTNISSIERRRQQCHTRDLPPEHPRASTSDDVECFISILHHMLGRTFDHKAFMNAYRKIFTEFQKMLDQNLPYYYYKGLSERFTLGTLPSFNEPSASGIERLDRVRGRRMGNPGTSVASRATMPRQGQRTVRDKFHRRQEPLPPLQM